MRYLKIMNLFLVGIALVNIVYYVNSSWKDIGNATMDDSWMFLRYAKHYTSGSGFSWNIEDGPAYGTTSVLYLFLITAARALTDWSDSAILAGTSFAFGLLSCIFLTYLGFLLAWDLYAREYWTPLLIIPSLLLMPAFRYHSLSGMETTLSLFTNTLLAISTIAWSQKRTSLRFVFCLLFGYLTFLARPDNGLYALLIPPLYLIATDRNLRHHATRYVLLFILILGLDLGFKKVLLGSFVPFSFFAKSNGFYTGYLGIEKWNAMTAMIAFCGTTLPFIIIIIFLSKRRVLPKLIAIGIPILLTFAYYAHVVQIMGYNARFYYPALPFFIMSAFMTLASYDEKTPHAIDFSNLITLTRILILFVILLPILFDSIGNKASLWWQRSMIGRPAVYYAEREYIKQSSDTLPQLEWSQSIIEVSNLLKRMPPEITLAASEYGIIGAEFPEIRIVDLVGLNDKQIAYHGFSTEQILSQKPDIIWFPPSDYSYEVARILDSEDFSQDYVYYPNAYNYGIALRTKSNFFSIMQSVFEEEFSRIYPGLESSEYWAKPSSTINGE